MINYLFYTLATLTIFTALATVLAKNPIRSVLYLIVTFFIITAQYVLLNAQFLAVVNIIVYAGAIMVLFLFVLMLLNLNSETEPTKSVGVKFAAVISSGILALVIIAALKDTTSPTVFINENSTAKGIGLVGALGKTLFTKYTIPFEVSSILFIAAMVGAILIGKREKQTETEQI